MRRMKSMWAVWVLVAPLLMGMGGLQELKSPGEIPIPNVNFGAIVTDVSGTATEIAQISFNGGTFLSGQHGKATITIDFDKIDEVVFAQKDQRLTATVKIRGGGEEKLDIDPATKCTGRTGFGIYQIDAKDIRLLKLKGIQK